MRLVLPAVLALIVLSPALAESPAGETAASREEMLLGGPCRDAARPGAGSWNEQRSFREEHDAAMKSGDLETAAAMRRELARLQCGNHFRWFSLAELLVEMRRPRQAIDILEYLRSQGSNEVGPRLDEESGALHPLVKTQEFLGSALATSLAADRDELAQRKTIQRERLAALPEGLRPPEAYVAEGACPFECCTFRAWSVETDTTLLDRAGGSATVGRVRRGESVTGLTGQVHIRPVPVSVRHSPRHSELPPGEMVFLLDRLGEGIGRVWHDGRILELEVAGTVRDHCPFPSESCWGEYIVPATDDERFGTWWVEIRTEDGTTGWTEEHGNFGNKDACG